MKQTVQYHSKAWPNVTAVYPPNGIASLPPPVSPCQNPACQKISAVLMHLAGSMVKIPQWPRAWSVVKFVITGVAIVVYGKTTSGSVTVEDSTCMSFGSLQLVSFGTVEDPPLQVRCFFLNKSDDTWFRTGQKKGIVMYTEVTQ